MCVRSPIARQVQVSVNGGAQPLWRNHAKELYYVEGNTLMEVSVSTEGSFTVGKPRSLFEDFGPALTSGGGGCDVSADGQRFLTVTPVARAARTNAHARRWGFKPLPNVLTLLLR
jgi:hypothetical protein